MKTIFVSFIWVLFWIIIGHFFSSVFISLTTFSTPIVFVLISKSIGRHFNKYVYVIVCFVLLLLQDYLFRIYGGGIHDDAGRGICELLFYSTLITSTIALFFIKIFGTLNKNDKKDKNKINYRIIILDVIFVFVISVLTYLFFRRFNLFIG